jgi:DNA-binding GntR family transcriptional regulator
VRVEADALKEIIEMRVICETGALRHAIERGDARWESEVIAAHHRMSRIEQDERQGSDEWFRAHREFHFALLAGCHNSHLLDLCSNLLDSADLYLRWTSSSLDDPESGSVLQGRDVAREHRDILDAVLQRNPDLAAALYTAHLELTGRLGIAALSSHSHPPLSPRAPKELPE